MYFSRLNGHPRDSVHTYGMITGLINSGISLGSTIGPVLSGAIIHVTDFSWSMTVIGFLALLMVCKKVIAK